jgi:hypothetical protein
MAADLATPGPTPGPTSSPTLGANPKPVAGDAPIFEVRGLVKHYPIGGGLRLRRTPVSSRPLMVSISRFTKVKRWDWSARAAAARRRWRAP